MAAHPQARIENDLCTTCGMCCDGTIFDFVRVEDGEAGRLSPHLALRAEPGHGTVFDQPCPQLKDRRCAIYAARPARCARYECEVLRGVKAGTVDIEDAHRRVAQAQKLAGELTGALAAGATLTEARRALRDSPAAWQGEDPNPDERMRIARARLLTVALNAFLDRHFRRKDRPLLPAPFGLDPPPESAPPVA